MRCCTFDKLPVITIYRLKRCIHSAVMHINSGKWAKPQLPIMGRCLFSFKITLVILWNVVGCHGLYLVSLYLISRGLDTPDFKVFGKHRWQFITSHTLISVELKDYMNTCFPLKREDSVTQSIVSTSILNATLMESCTVFLQSLYVLHISS